jgi:hypothetical protein
MLAMIQTFVAYSRQTNRETSRRRYSYHEVKCRPRLDYDLMQGPLRCYKGHCSQKVLGPRHVGLPSDPAVRHDSSHRGAQ